MARNKKFSSVEVIDKSIDVFLAKGFEATAIKDLVKATNVHPGSLYNAFGNKKKIFMNHSKNESLDTGKKLEVSDRDRAFYKKNGYCHPRN